MSQELVSVALSRAAPSTLGPVNILPLRPQPPVPIGKVDVLGAFLAGRNPRTLDAYRKDLEDFGRHLGTTPADAAEWLLSRAHGEANRVVHS